MNELQLKKTANEVRKGIITAVYNAKAGRPVSFSRSRSVHISLF